ncbi:MAG: hypothetical protein NTZ01_00935 [Verrucomicrobia bacterium]|nr:hypothetical protein [Verrucomicrobiota bacterium]
MFLVPFLGIWVPLSFWARWGDPHWITRFDLPWDSPVLGVAVGVMIFILLVLPVIWMSVTRVMDMVGLTLAHQALILISYFFIEQTSANLGSREVNNVFAGLPWILLINLIGFGILLPVLGCVYGRVPLR